MKNVCLIAFVMIITSSSLTSEARDIRELLPGDLSGWRISGETKLYTPASLYDYIDGGAELYISYGMKEVVSCIYEREGTGEIRVEIFDMARAEDAFGVFSHTRTTDEKEFGQGSQYFTGAQVFWKDHYYVAITANDENDEIIKAIRLLAARIDQKIESHGALPAMLEMLPEENLVKDGYIFFHHYIWLNSYYYISDDNLLNIDNTTKAVLAKYGDKDQRYYLLLVEYANNDLAIAAHRNLLEAIFNNKDTIMKLENEGWMGTRTQGNYLVATFNAPSAGAVENIMNNCLLKRKITP